MQHGGYTKQDLERLGLQLVFTKHGPILQKVVKERQIEYKPKYTHKQGVIGVFFVGLVLLLVYWLLL